jgi:hypothetical protein
VKIGSSDIWMVTLDVAGNIVAQQTLGGTFDELAAAVYPLPDGSIITAGTTFSDDGDVVNAIDEVSNFWLVKHKALFYADGRC